MHRIRPHLGITAYAALGTTVGMGSALAWHHILAPYRLSQWALLLIAGVTALGVLRLLAEVQHRRNRPRTRRTHARAQPVKTTKETA